MIDPDKQAAYFGLPPRRVAWPGRAEGFSAAVFSAPDEGEIELGAPPDPETHVLTVTLRPPSRFALDIDGRLVRAVPTRRGAVQAVLAGRRPHARVAGRWKIVQFFLPTRTVAALAEELGLVNLGPQAIELRDPDFEVDRWLLGRSLDLSRRLERGEALTRLEMDVFALELSEHVLAHYSNAPLPPPTDSLGSRESRHLSELLRDQPDASLDDAARALDRPTRDVRRHVRRPPRR